MSGNPLVSIVALNYNNYNYVISTLDSIAQQDYPNIELIVVDDFSSDGSLELIKQWAIKCKIKIKIILHEENRGICAACNSALKLSEGKYICLIATDDVMSPNKTSRQVETIEKMDSSIGAIYSDMNIINEHGLVVNYSYFSLIDIDEETIKNVYNRTIADQIAYFIDKNIITTPSVLYKKEVVEKLGGWDESLYFEDLDMNLRIIHAGYKFAWINDSLVSYRLLHNSMARRPNPFYFESYLTLIYKYYGLSKSVDFAVNGKIKDYSLQIYKLNGRKSFYWLVKRFVILKDLKTLLIMVFAFLRINYSSVKFLSRVIA